MSHHNRDIIVLTKKLTMNPEELEHEIEFLNDLLYHAESMYNLCNVTEIIDINRYRVIRKPHLVMQTFRAKEFKPFVFISNRN